MSEISLERAREWADAANAGASRTPESGPSVASFASVAPWPSLSDAALQGLPGEFVRLVEPHSEADPAALLVQFLVGIGNLIGRGPHFEVEADHHGVNLFAVMVGDTSKGRKGVSWGHVRRVLGRVEPDWLDRVKSGISSGEGIVHEVRDPTYKTDKEGNEEVVDEGVSDKRLLLVEPEFAQVLKVATRHGNTVSTVIRDAWDQSRLSPLTKNNRLCASNPHISIVGHVTRQELLRLLTETEAANGFGNRFLWVCAKRSKLLPRGGQLHREDLAPLTRRIQEAVEFARTIVRVDRTEETWSIWDPIYGPLSEGKPGLMGAMVGRSEAQATRLSALYAILDGSSLIRPEHQEAALAVWDYCEASARYVFGDNLGDPVADEVVQALRKEPRGLTRTEIHGLFGRHKTGDQVSRALETLEAQNLARCVSEAGPGRHPKRWFATANQAKEATEGYGGRS